MKICRGILTALFSGLAGLGMADAPEGLILVAHRGVVTETVTENSLESLEGAIRRGYTHVEVDIRITKDGHAVCLHDSSLRRTTGVDKQIHEVTLRKLRKLVPENVVPSFETYCETAAGRIDLMPDIKDYPTDLRDAFIASIDATMTKYGLMENALFIGRKEIGSAFMGRARVSVREDPEQFAESDRGRDNPGRNYFVFGHAADFTRESVRAYQALGLQVVVSINTFHYLRGDYMQQGLDDVDKMLDYGVDGLQLDAVYDANVTELVRNLTDEQL